VGTARVSSSGARSITRGAPRRISVRRGASRREDAVTAALAAVTQPLEGTPIKCVEAIGVLEAGVQ
jgi:hypothetical protein